MLCKIFPTNYHKIGFGILLLVLPVVLSVFFSLDTNAASDVVYNLVRPESGSVSYEFCGTENTPPCSDFSYAIFQPTSDSIDYFNVSTRKTLRLPTFSNSILFLNSTYVSLSFQFYATTPLSSLVVTLTDSLSVDCPVCEECQTCPAIPENPYDDKFDKLIIAVYVCAATLLVIYFFYCIYRMIIKSSKGGN